MLRLRPTGATSGVYYSPDYFGGSDSSIYIPVGFDILLPSDFGLYFSYSYFDLDATGSYSHYGFGLTKTLLGVDMDLSWVNNDNGCEVVQGVNCGVSLPQNHFNIIFLVNFNHINAVAPGLSHGKIEENSNEIGHCDYQTLQAG